MKTVAHMIALSVIGMIEMFIKFFNEYGSSIMPYPYALLHSVYTVPKMNSNGYPKEIRTIYSFCQDSKKPS